VTGIEAAVRALSAADQLLVMTDYDGTLAPLVPDPAEAVVDEPTITVLGSLAAKPSTAVAVVSGRRLADLERFLPIPGLVLVGGHGAETGGPAIVGDDERATLERVVAELEEIAALDRGALVEVKETSAALHVRRVTAVVGERLLDLARAGPGHLPGVRVIEGNSVVDLTISSIDKGTAVRALRARHPGGLAVFIGDDVTDESAFAALPPPDLTVKVGEGPTSAALRLPDQASVRPFLEAVAQGRASDFRP
jgi:trehalose 6-phosphate phosphatase